MKKIEKVIIPEPCNEDWNKMTTNEQGRFCKSCEKTVVDFTSNSKYEIHQYLKDNSNTSICGRVNAHTINEKILVNPRVLNFKQRKLRMFAYACMLVFGPALFSFTCEQQKEISLVELTDKKEVIEFTSKSNVIITEDSIFDTIISSLTPEIDLIKIIDNPTEVENLLGEMIVEDDTVTQITAKPKNKLVLDKCVITNEEPRTLKGLVQITGGMSIREYTEVLEYPTKDSLANKEDFKEIKLYPNPTSLVAYLDFQFNNKEENNAILYLYSLNGILVSSQKLNFNDGKISNYAIDISNLTTGTYLVNVITTTEKLTSKLVIN